MDIFETARSAVDRIWDFNERTIRPNITPDMINEAKAAVSKIDDDMMREMLSQAVSEAEVQFNNNSPYAESPVLVENNKPMNNNPVQAVESVFDFKERVLKDNVTEEQMQNAIHAVETMDKNSPDYDFLVVAVGMAEREFNALSNQEEKIKKEFSDVDGVSLKDINKRLAESGFDDSEIEAPEIPLDSEIEEETNEPESEEDDVEFFDDEETPEEAKKRKKKEAQAERAAKAKANAERSRKNQQEYQKRRTEEENRRRQQEQLERDAENTRQQSEASVVSDNNQYNNDQYENTTDIQSERDRQIALEQAEIRRREQEREQQFLKEQQEFERKRLEREAQYREEQEVALNKYVSSSDINDTQSYFADTTEASSYDREKEDLRQAAERQRAEYEAQKAEEMQRMQDAQQQRMTDTRDWENAKHGENLNAVHLDTQKATDLNQNRYPDDSKSTGSDNITYGNDYQEPTQNQGTPLNQDSNQYGDNRIDNRENSYTGSYGSDKGHSQGNNYDTHDYGNNTGYDQDYNDNRHEHPYSANHHNNYGTDYGTGYGRTPDNQSPQTGQTGSVPPVITVVPDGGKVGGEGIHGDFPTSTQGNNEPSSYESYTYGNSQNTDSYFEQQKRQGMEDDLQQQKSEEAARNQGKVDDLVEEARRRRESAEEFSKNRHSNMTHHDDNIERNKQVIHGAVGNEDTGKGNQGSGYTSSSPVTDSKNKDEGITSGIQTGNIGGGSTYSPTGSDVSHYENRAGQDTDAGPGRKRTPHHYRSDNYRPQGQIVGSGNQYNPIPDGPVKHSAGEVVAGMAAGAAGKVKNVFFREENRENEYSKRLPIGPEDLTNKSTNPSYGSIYSNKTAYGVGNRGAANPYSTNRSGKYGVGTVIGTGADFKTGGKSTIIHRGGNSGKVAGAVMGVTGAVSTATGMVTNDEGHIIQGGITAAGATVAVASAAGVSIIEGVRKRAEINKVLRETQGQGNYPTGSTGPRPPMGPSGPGGGSRGNPPKPSLKPTFGARETFVDPVTGKKYPFGKKPDFSETDRYGLDIPKEKRTSTERRVGSLYASRTHSSFIYAIYRPTIATGKAGANLLFNLDAYRQTDVGQTGRKIRETTDYAKGAVAVAGAMGSLASIPGTMGKNIGKGIAGGLRYYTGNDLIGSGSSAVKVGSHIIPIRNRAINKQWTAFNKQHGDIVGSFTRKVEVGDFQKVPNWVKNNKLNATRGNNSTIYGVFDRGRLEAEIKAMKIKLKAGKLTPDDIKHLEDLKKFKSLTEGKLGSQIRREKFKKMTRSVARVSFILSNKLQNTDNAGTKGVALMVTTSKFVYAGLKVQYKAIRMAFSTRPGKYVKRQAGRVGKVAGEAAGTAVKGVASIPGRAVAHHLGMDYNRYKQVKKAYIEGIKSKMTGPIHGGIHNAVKANVQKVGKKVGETKAGQVVGGVANKVGKGLDTLKKGLGRVGSAAGKVGAVVTKPLKALGTLATAANAALTKIKVILAAVAAAICLIFFIFVIAGTSFIETQTMFMTDSDNLQRYINYAIDVSQDWYAGRLTGSKTNVGGSNQGLNDVYDKGGNERGKYRIVTTKYLDADGKEIDSNDNLKEILAMVAVKTFNEWPEDWDLIDVPIDGDDWTVGEVQNLIKFLYAASHKWEAEEKGPYFYYVEKNNANVTLLSNPEYPGSGSYSKKLLGDGEGEACLGPRKFYCNESSVATYASEYRKEMNKSYKPRGGCTIDYYGYGTYDCATDTITLDGQLHDGTKKITNAHSKIWATDDMKQRYQVSQSHGGKGDESRKKHADSYGAPASGCHDYSVTYAHTHETTNRPATGCTNYYLKTPANTTVCNFPDTFPSTVTFTWNSTTGKYEYVVGTTIHSLSSAFDAYSGNSITFRYMSSIVGYADPGAGRDLYIPDGTKFICRDSTYHCNETEYYCEGHRERVRIYYCPGHNEYYCDKNHYDLDINITISHFDKDKLFHDDVDNSYNYKRKSKDISEYPDDFDKNKEESSDDFYWDEENIESAKNYIAYNWEEIYDDISGFEDVTMEMDTDTLDRYKQYLDVDHINKWYNGIPLKSDGETVRFIGTKNWFYDETRGKYIQVEKKSNGVGATFTYTIVKQSDTSPANVTNMQKKIINQALAAVGKIPYIEGGAPETGSILSDYGWVDDDQSKGVKRGLDSGGFVAWVYQKAGKNLTNTDSIKKLWDKSEEIGTRKTVKDEDLKAGDLAFINSYDNRKNDAVEQSDEDLIPFNTVAIYLGTNEKGQRIYIQCSRTNGVVSVTTSNAFNYYRRVSGVS